jgi:ADP-ribosylglycohydrolase
MQSVDKSRVAGSLKGMIVGDALSMPQHWFYSPTKMRAAYGHVSGMMAPKRTHAESMVQGMSYDGSIDIMHDKAGFYAGATAAEAAKKLSAADIQKRRDDHGNFVGAEANERIHYHASLKQGQNTTNVCLARVLMRCIAESNVDSSDLYTPDLYLQKMYTYMTTPPDPEDSAQLKAHNDVYMDVFLRGFFTNASKGLPLTACALSQRQSWSIGSLDGVVMSIPMIAAYANEPEFFVLGRAVEHHMLTHRSVTVTASVTIVTHILHQLYRGSDLRETIEASAETMCPPKVTGREMADSYVNHRGPGNIPKQEKWRQHMVLDESETLMQLIRRCLDWDDEDVAGWGDRPNSRLSTACYCEQTLSTVLYLAYKYADKPEEALLANARIGGHSTARGAVLGAILGAAHGDENVPFFDDICAPEAVKKEVAGLVATLP